MRSGSTMSFLGSVTPEEMQAGRMLSTLTLAAIIGVGFVPWLRPYAGRIRIAITGLYLLGILGFVIYFLIGS